MAIRHALFAACTLAASGCRSGKAAQVPPAVPVRIAPVVQVDAPITIEASGVVAPTQTVNVETQETGTLTEVDFREGQHVDSGQVLFRIDSRALQAALEQAKAALARDVALADAAVKDDARYRTLANEDYVTKEQADQMHAAALGQQATARADSAAIRTAQVNLGFTTVRAPIAGRTGKLIVRLGNVVSPGTGPLVVINQLHPIMVQFPVLSEDLPLLRSAVKSHPLPVTAVASDTTNVTETGQLSLLDNAIDSLTGTVTGQAVLPNAHALFWPGQLVTLTIKAGVQRGAVAVHTEAVMTGQKGNYVFVVDPAAKTAQMRTIVAGRNLGELTIITSGVKPGEQVVVDGQSRVAPGSHVTVVTGAVPGDTTQTLPAPVAPAGTNATTKPGAPAPAAKPVPAAKPGPP